MAQGKEALVDDEDYEELSQYTWTPMKNGRTWYAYRWTSRKNPPRQNILMHRQVMRAPKGTRIDHRDGNGLNNQRQNLRFTTQQENLRNQRHKKADATSKYKGVYYSKHAKKWVMQITLGTLSAKGHKQRLKRNFETEEEAARAYDDSARKLFGDFAALNFPPSA